MTGTDGRPTDDNPPGTGAPRGRRAGTAPADGGAVGRETPPGRREDVTVGPGPWGPGGGERGGGNVGGGDTVAAVVRQWRAVHPDLDTAPMEIIGRINRCAALLQQAEDAPLRRAGLSRPEFDLLGALRRTGDELTPSELARETFSSGAAVTKRLKQLTERGLVERRGDARDRRVAHLRLTETGRELVDGVLPEQLAYERAVLAGLETGERDELAGLLGDLLGRLEGRPGAGRG
ncbi:MarR family winged helix-turn-helix transcriptional regulator [Streptomyces sp. NPDC014864]|uniref:MarR family winged helix-turn-helix transcriptional regulator n=1 Tax=Streptomyces sp. NPDC014864 TaxID=3364924 RepID=UPI0036FD6F82